MSHGKRYYMLEVSCELQAYNISVASSMRLFKQQYQVGCADIYTKHLVYVSQSVLVI